MPSHDLGLQSPKAVPGRREALPCWAPCSSLPHWDHGAKGCRMATQLRAPLLPDGCSQNAELIYEWWRKGSERLSCCYNQDKGVNPIACV